MKRYVVLGLILALLAIGFGTLASPIVVGGSNDAVATCEGTGTGVPGNGYGIPAHASPQAFRANPNAFIHAAGGGGGEDVALLSVPIVVGGS